MKAFMFPVLLILGGGICAAAGAPAITAITPGGAAMIQRLGFSCLLADGAGGSTSAGARTFPSPLSGCDCHVNIETEGILTSKSLPGGGAAAATVPDQSDLSAPAGDTNSTGGGAGARGALPSEHSGCHMTETDFLDTANLTGGYGSIELRFTLDGCDLVQGSGGEQKISTPAFAGTLGYAPAQHFPSPNISSRCGSALRAGGGSFTAPLGPRHP
eukprot:SAG22_NODE_166_length_16765_cov_30.782791_17_plen_215_part_00